MALIWGSASDLGFRHRHSAAAAKINIDLHSLGPLRTILCGGIGGMSFWAAIFPADVLKSRAQVQMKGTEKSAGFMTTLVHIAKHEGKNLNLI